LDNIRMPNLGEWMRMVRQHACTRSWHFSVASGNWIRSPCCDQNKIHSTAKFQGRRLCYLHYQLWQHSQ
jgi:hypothetical protein